MPSMSQNPAHNSADPLEADLSRLDAPAPGAPPAPFLERVRARRRRVVAQRSSLAALAVLTLALGLTLVTSFVTALPDPREPGRIAADDRIQRPSPDAPPLTDTPASSAPSRMTLAGLRQLYTGAETRADLLESLPSAPANPTASAPLRLGDSSAALDALNASFPSGL